MTPYQAYMVKAAELGLETYAEDHKHDALRSIGNNIAYGLLSNPRGSGPISILGSSAGGVVDGLLFKPVVNATADLIGKGLRSAYGVKSEP
jgi:hypothetical protein